MHKHKIHNRLSKECTQGVGVSKCTFSEICIHLSHGDPRVSQGSGIVEFSRPLPGQEQQLCLPPIHLGRLGSPILATANKSHTNNDTKNAVCFVYTYLEPTVRNASVRP